MEPPPFFHSDINPVLCHILVHSINMFWLWQWNWFSCCSWIYFRSILFKHGANLSGSKDLEGAMYTTLLLFQPTIGKVSMLFGLLYAVHSDHVPFFAAICPQWKYLCLTYFCRLQLLIKYCQLKKMWKADKKVWSSYYKYMITNS